jgi:hypothetical protein
MPLIGAKSVKNNIYRFKDGLIQMKQSIKYEFSILIKYIL